MSNIIDESLSGQGAEESGQFEGKFLLAMPSMGSNVFERSIVYICAHSFDGAMGFLVNKSSEMTIEELIKSAEVANKDDIVLKKSKLASNMVRIGGPVDEHRGFVLHSNDYDSNETIPISDVVYLTSNIQILRSIAKGDGPKKMVVSLGYSGWDAGQLEQEIAENAWLIIDADPDMVFDPKDEGKYEKLLSALGINSANFVADAGNA